MTNKRLKLYASGDAKRVEEINAQLLSFVEKKTVKWKQEKRYKGNNYVESLKK